MHVFTPLSRAERQAFVAHYREYLRRRDGVPDTTTYTFSVREPLFRELEGNPVIRTGEPIVDEWDLLRPITSERRRSLARDTIRNTAGAERPREVGVQVAVHQRQRCWR